MKNKKNIKQDLAFVKRHLDAAPDLPETLESENIVRTVTGEKQKAPLKKTLRRAISVAVAACVVISVTVVYRASVYAPNLSADAITYKEVGRLMGDYHRAQSIRDSFYSLSNFGIRKTMDYAEAEYGFHAYDDAEVAVTAVDSYNAGIAEESVAEKPASTAATTTGDHGKTNTREKDVFEADFIQTDGRYLYLLSSGSFRVIDTAGGSMRLAGSLELSPAEDSDAEDGTWTEMAASGFYLYGQSVIFVGTQYDYTDYRCTVQARVDVYNCADPANMTLTRSLVFDGSLLSSRLTNGKMVVVTQYYPDMDKVAFNDYQTFIPAVYENGEADYLPESCLYLGSAECPESFTSVAMFSPDDDAAEITRSAVFGSGGDIYCTQDTLYAYHTTYDSGYFFARNLGAGTATNILSFDISGDAPVFHTKGSIPGYLLNTFSLDAYNGYLRAAATCDGKNYVYVLDGDLEIVGKSEALAEGEQIYGVRFSGNTAYVVTFYQTDPLFVLDLTDPAMPTLKGELKLPGFSSYLHPVGDGLLLGLGRGGDENGTDGSAKASLFDVSDPQNPKEVGAVIIRDAWFHENYKAFVDMGDGSFLVPYSRYYDSMQIAENGAEIYQYKNVSGAVRLRVENGTLTLAGSYDVNKENGDTPRATYIGQTVYIAYLMGWTNEIDVYAFGRDTFAETDALSVETAQDGVRTYAWNE